MMTLRHAGACAVLGVAAGLHAVRAGHGAVRQAVSGRAAERDGGWEPEGRDRGLPRDCDRQGVARDLASQALLRMAEAYQKLGDPQARAVYGQLVRDFPDQRQIVETARTRLAALETPSHAPDCRSGASIRASRSSASRLTRAGRCSTNSMPRQTVSRSGPGLSRYALRNQARTRQAPRNRRVRRS